MFNFIRHSPFLSFDKRQKLHTYIYIYIDIYKSKNHSSIKIQTARTHLQYHSHHCCHQISPEISLLIPKQCAKAERDHADGRRCRHQRAEDSRVP